MADLVREWKIAVHDPEVAKLEARIGHLQRALDAANLMLGYVVHEQGGEAMIGHSTMLLHDRFKLESEENVQGGMIIRATPL